MPVPTNTINTIDTYHRNTSGLTNSRSSMYKPEEYVIPSMSRAAEIDEYMNSTRGLNGVSDQDQRRAGAIDSYNNARRGFDQEPSESSETGQQSAEQTKEEKSFIQRFEESIGPYVELSDEEKNLYYSNVGNMIAEGKDPTEWAEQFLAINAIARSLGVTRLDVLEGRADLIRYFYGQDDAPLDFSIGMGIVNAIEQGFRMNKLQKYYKEYRDLFYSGFDENSPEVQQRLSQIDGMKNRLAMYEDTTQKSKNKVADWAIKTFDESIQQLPYMGKGMIAGFVGGTVGTAVTGSPVGGKIGASLARFMTYYGGFAGEAFYNMKQAGMSTETALKYSNLDGIINGLNETFLDTLTDNFTGAVTSIGKSFGLGGNAVLDFTTGLFSYATKSLMDNGHLASYASRLAFGQILGPIGEFAQEFSQAMTSDILLEMGLRADKLNVPHSFRENWREWVESGVQGYLTSFFLGPFGLAVNVRSDVKTAAAIRDAAGSTPSKEAFVKSKAVKDMVKKISVNENADEASVEKALGDLWTEAQKERADIARMAASNAETSETGKAQESGAPKGTKEVSRKDGRLRTSLIASTTDADGKIHSTIGFGSFIADSKQDKEKATPYGTLEVEIDKSTNTATITGLNVEKGYEYHAMEMVRTAIENQLQGYNVEWDAQTDFDQAVKDGLLKTNPNSSSLNFQYSDQRNSELESVITEIQANNGTITAEGIDLGNRYTQAVDPDDPSKGYYVRGGVTHEEARIFANILQSLADKYNMGLREFINAKMGGQVLINDNDSRVQAALSKAPTMRGFSQAAQGMKGAIYVAQHGDITTFNHELFHVALRIDAEERNNLAKAIQGIVGDDKKLAKLKAYIADHSEIFGSRSIDEIVEELSDLKDGDAILAAVNENGEEFLTQLYESWLSDKSKGAQIDSEIAGVLSRLADFVKKVYRIMKDSGVQINEELDQAFTSLMGFDGSVAQGASEQVNTGARNQAMRVSDKVKSEEFLSLQNLNKRKKNGTFIFRTYDDMISYLTTAPIRRVGRVQVIDDIKPSILPYIKECYMADMTNHLFSTDMRLFASSMTIRELGGEGAPDGVNGLYDGRTVEFKRSFGSSETIAEDVWNGLRKSHDIIVVIAGGDSTKESILNETIGYAKKNISKMFDGSHKIAIVDARDINNPVIDVVEVDKKTLLESRGAGLWPPKDINLNSRLVQLKDTILWKIVNTGDERLSYEDYFNESDEISDESLKHQRQIQESDQEQIAMEHEAEEAASTARFQIDRNYNPQKIGHAYKMFEMDIRDGSLHPLFINNRYITENGVERIAKKYDSNGNEIASDDTSSKVARWEKGAYRKGVKQDELGLWMIAENIPTKDFSLRPGWHLGSGAPVAPWLAGKTGIYTATNGKYFKRVWCEVSYPMDKDYQSELDERGIKDIKNHTPENGYYKFRESNNSLWIIAGALRIDRIIPDSELIGIMDREQPTWAQDIADYQNKKYKINLTAEEVRRNWSTASGIPEGVTPVADALRMQGWNYDRNMSNNAAEDAAFAGVRFQSYNEKAYAENILRVMDTALAPFPETSVPEGLSESKARSFLKSEEARSREERSAAILKLIRTIKKDEEGNLLVPDIVKAIAERSAQLAEKYGISWEDLGSDKSVDRLSRMIVADVNSRISNMPADYVPKGWYSTAVRNAMNIFSQTFPELAVDAQGNATVDFDAVVAFKICMAITSQGQDIFSNSALAAQCYRFFKENGRFPNRKSEMAGAIRPTADATNFAKINELRENFGWTFRDLNDAFGMMMSVSEIEKSGYAVSGVHKGAEYPFGAILGPKIGGGFLVNLLGYYDSSTLDMWMRRGLGRMTGIYSENDTFSAIEKKALREAIDKAVERLNKNLKNTEERWTAADVQAILWYNEKDLIDRIQSQSVKSVGASYADGAAEVVLRERDAERYNALSNEEKRKERNYEISRVSGMSENDTGEYKADGYDPGDTRTGESLQAGNGISGTTEEDFREAEANPEQEASGRREGSDNGSSDEAILSRRWGSRNGYARWARRVGGETSRQVPGLRGLSTVAPDGSFKTGSVQLTKNTSVPLNYDRSFNVSKEYAGNVMLFSKLRINVPENTIYGITDAQSNSQIKNGLQKSSRSYLQLFNKAKKTQGVYQWRLSEYKSKDFNGKNGKSFISDDGRFGFTVTNDGDLVGVFSDASVKGALYSIIPAAIENGATHLDCYNTESRSLVEAYSRFGFRPVAKVKFDRNYMSEGWAQNIDVLGEPDIVFMVFDPVLAESNPSYKVQFDSDCDLLQNMEYSSDYDEGQKKAKEEALAIREKWDAENMRKQSAAVFGSPELIHAVDANADESFGWIDNELAGTLRRRNGIDQDWPQEGDMVLSDSIVPADWDMFFEEKKNEYKASLADMALTLSEGMPGGSAEADMVRAAIEINEGAEVERRPLTGPVAFEDAPQEAPRMQEDVTPNQVNTSALDIDIMDGSDATKDRLFIRALSDERAVTDMLSAMARSGRTLDEDIAEVASRAGSGSLSADDIQKAADYFTENARASRQLMSELFSRQDMAVNIDSSDLPAIETAEDYLSKDQTGFDVRRRRSLAAMIKDRNIASKVIDGTITDEELAEAINKKDEEIKALQEKVKAGEGQLQGGISLMNDLALKLDDKRRENDLGMRLANRINERRALLEVRSYKKKLAKSLFRKWNENVDFRTVAPVMNEIRRKVNPKFVRNWLYDPVKNPNGETGGATMKFIDAVSMVDGYETGVLNEQNTGVSKEEIRRRLGAKLYNQLQGDAAKPLNEWTIKDLEALNDRLNSAWAEGRKIRQAQVQAVKERRRGLIDSITDTIMATKQYKNGDGRNFAGGTAAAKEGGFAAKLRALSYSVKRMQELARMLDGVDGAENRALLVESVRDCQDAEALAIERRLTAYRRAAEAANAQKGRGYAEDWMYSSQATASWNGQSFLGTELAYIYLSQYNAKAKAAVKYGSLMTAEEKGYYTGERDASGEAMLKGKYSATIQDDETFEEEAERRYGEMFQKAEQAIRSAGMMDVISAISDDLWNPANGQALLDFSLDTWNIPVVLEDHYLPVRRMDSTGTNAIETKDDVLSLASGKYLDKVRDGFLEEKKTIPMRQQKPANMDLMGVWANSVQEQEHLMSTGRLLADIQAVYEKSSEVRDAIRRAFGREMLQEIDNYLHYVADPNYDDAKEDVFKSLRIFQGSTASAYLGFKISSIINQAIFSPVPFAGEAKLADLAKGYAAMLAHPIEAWEFVTARSIMMKNRSASVIIEAIRESQKDPNGNGFLKARDSISEVGLKGLEWIDRYCVASGWLGVYYTALDAEIAAGRSTEEAEKAAVAKADEVVLRTQPTGTKTELARLFRSNNAMGRLILQFQTALNTVYNNLWVDTAQDLEVARESKDQARRDEAIRRVVGHAVGFALSGILYGALTEGLKGKADDDDEAAGLRRFLSVIRWAFSQGIESLPVVGSLLSRGMDAIITGKARTGTSDFSIFPATSRFMDGVVKTGVGAQKTDGSRLSAMGKGAERLLDGLGLFIGLPVSTIKQAKRAITEKSFWPIVGR